MDTMHISANFICKIVERLVKRWLRKKIGITPVIKIERICFDLQDNFFKLEMEANGNISKEERFALIDYLFSSKGKET